MFVSTFEIAYEYTLLKFLDTNCRLAKWTNFSRSRREMHGKVPRNSRFLHLHSPQPWTVPRREKEEKYFIFLLEIFEIDSSRAARTRRYPTELAVFTSFLFEIRNIVYLGPMEVPEGREISLLLSEGQPKSRTLGETERESVPRTIISGTVNKPSDAERKSDATERWFLGEDGSKWKIFGV